jgi:hypothetical protein
MRRFKILIGHGGLGIPRFKQVILFEILINFNNLKRSNFTDEQILCAQEIKKDHFSLNSSYKVW